MSNPTIFKKVRSIATKPQQTWGRRLLPRFKRNSRGELLQLHATKGWRKA